MHRILITLLICIGNMNAQSQETNLWETKFSTDLLAIEYTYSDCHFPEKGVHNRYLLLKITNTGNQEIDVAYDLDRWYNNKKSSPDKNGFSHALAPGESIAASCSELKKGLHLFARKLDVQAESTLTNFNLENVRVNGKPLTQ